MGNFYTYLIASLPMLQFGMKPPFSFERFLELCHRFIPEKDFQLLNNLPQPEEYAGTVKRPRVVQKWVAFDVALRNELAKIRAAKKHLEPVHYLRPDESSNSSIAPVAMAASMHTSILEAEWILDEARWRFLDELATGHHFDKDFLITYALKLLILQRWERIHDADTKILFKQVYSINGV